jgi:SAM-dependent methyltransferase
MRGLLMAHSMGPVRSPHNWSISLACQRVPGCWTSRVGSADSPRPLHDVGYDVTAVEASSDQIHLARRDNPGPRYLVGDMREPPPGPFDAVLNLYSSFGYFDDPADDMRCLAAWYDVLRPGGVLVLETMHRDRVAWLWGQDFDPGTRRETGTTDWTTGVRTSTVEVDGDRRKFRVRLYTVTNLVRAMEEVGFVRIEAFGGLDGTALDPSKRLAIRAHRA